MSSRKAEAFRSGFVALVGRSNVGKSTLVNALLGFKVSIVSSKPQTTRHRILGVKNGPGWQVVFVDTPGVYEPLHALGRYVQSVARREGAEADLMLFVADGSRSPSDEDREAARLLFSRSVPLYLVLNKADLLKPGEIEERTAEYRALGAFNGASSVSALRRKGLDGLMKVIVGNLAAGVPWFPPEETTDQRVDLRVAELIRERVLHFTRQEIPHSTAVQVDGITEGRSPEVLHVMATIYVEKDSQKKIVVGAGGSMLKKVGSACRPEIEAILGKKVFLELWVKVKKDWREREDFLKTLGYW